MSDTPEQRVEEVNLSKQMKTAFFVPVDLRGTI